MYELVTFMALFLFPFLDLKKKKTHLVSVLYVSCCTILVLHSELILMLQFVHPDNALRTICAFLALIKQIVTGNWNRIEWICLLHLALCEIVNTPRESWKSFAGCITFSGIYIVDYKITIDFLFRRWSLTSLQENIRRMSMYPEVILIWLKLEMRTIRESAEKILL